MCRLRLMLFALTHTTAKNHDEDPIYMFDPVRSACDRHMLSTFSQCFDEREPSLLADYTGCVLCDAKMRTDVGVCVVPRYFAEDLFAVLGNDRPDYMCVVRGVVCAHVRVSGGSYSVPSALARRFTWCVLCDRLVVCAIACVVGSVQDVGVECGARGT
jgi:hypothetical protein